MAHRRQVELIAKQVPQFCAFGRPENLGTDGLNLLGVSCGSCPLLVAAPPAQSAASSDRAGVYTRLDRAVCTAVAGRPICTCERQDLLLLGGQCTQRQ